MTRTFTLKVDTDNEAFQPAPALELARILRGIACYIEEGGSFSFYQTVFDVNGNDVGRFAIKEVA